VRVQARALHLFQWLESRWELRAADRRTPRIGRRAEVSTLPRRQGRVRLEECSSAGTLRWPPRWRIELAALASLHRRHRSRLTNLAVLPLVHTPCPCHTTPAHAFGPHQCRRWGCVILPVIWVASSAGTHLQHDRDCNRLPHGDCVVEWLLAASPRLDPEAASPFTLCVETDVGHHRDAAASACDLIGDPLAPGPPPPPFPV